MTDVVLERRQLAEIILPTEWDNLFVAPTTPELADGEVQMAGLNRKFTRLQNALNNAPQFDYVIIDSPPSLSLLTVNGLIAARYVLLPVQAEFYALEGLGQLLETMKLIRKGLNPTLDLVGVLPTMVDSRTKAASRCLRKSQNTSQLRYLKRPFLAMFV